MSKRKKKPPVQPSSAPRVLRDPLEQIIADALTKADVRYLTEGEGNPSHLDFNCVDNGFEVEVKLMHTPRIAKQMARVPNLFMIVGPKATQFFADHIVPAMK